MNAPPRRQPGAGRRRQRLDRRPRGRGAEPGRARTVSSRWARTSASAPPPTRASAGERAGRRCCSTPTPSCSTTASTGSPPRPRELGGAGRPAGAEPRPQRPALGQRSRGRGLAVGPGAGPRRDPARRGCGRAPSPTGSSAASRSPGSPAPASPRRPRCCAGSGPSTRRCTCTARTSTSACAPPRPASRRGSTPPPAAIVHHGQGSSHARLRLARGLAADRDAQLARRPAPRLRPAARALGPGARCGSTCACG